MPNYSVAHLFANLGAFFDAAAKVSYSFDESAKVGHV